MVHPLSLPFRVASQPSLLTSSTFVNLSSPPATAELHSPAAEVKEGMVRAEGWAGMLSGSYLFWIPFCSSCSGANVKTTVLCSRLQREEGREEAGGLRGSLSSASFFSAGPLRGHPPCL